MSPKFLLAAAAAILVAAPALAEIKIEDAGGNAVLMVSGNLDKGNHQAHDE